MKKLLLITLCIIGVSFGEWIRICGNSESAIPPTTAVNQSDTSFVRLKTITFGFTSQDTVINDSTFKLINFPGEMLMVDTFKAGKPRIPYIRLQVAVPDSCTINITPTCYNNISFDDYLMYPTPRIIFIDSNGCFGPQEVFTFDTTFYQKDTTYPGKFYEIKNDGHWRDQRVLEVYVYPLQYNPGTRTVNFYSELELRIEYVGAKFVNTNGLGPIEDVGRDMLLNYPGIDVEPRSVPIPTVHYYTNLLDPNNLADYIIVTNETFLLNEMTGPLIDSFAWWRVNHNQFHVAIVTVQDIFAQFEPHENDSVQLRNFFEACL